MTKKSIDKDSLYRSTILNAVENDKLHPVNNGIDMQAHHIISSKGVQDSEVYSQLEEMDYQINAIKNLVLLPCTLKGACHLGVQLHRGNHTFHDDEHPRSYHKEVTERIKSLEEELDRKCASNKPIQGLLNKESVKILDMIKKFKLPLTKIFLSFQSSGKLKFIGCSNSDSVPKHNANINCNLNRVHFSETIPQEYNLEVGQ